MFRGNTRALLLRAEIASAELRRLLPLLPSKTHESKASSQSVASLVVSTVFAGTKNRLPTSHSRDCPVVAKSLPLSRVSIEASFMARPCTSCVSERVHYLASVVFCDDFEHRCRIVDAGADGVTRVDASKLMIRAGALEKEITASFGSIAAFKDSVLQLSQSAMTPGRLWVVYRPSTEDTAGGHLHLLSLPGCKVPLAHGLWPLAVVNVSEERVCGELERCVKKVGSHTAGGGAAQPPAWSRAARTPGAAATAAGDVGERLDGDAVERIQLADLQAAVVRRAVDAMNWNFVEEQLASAVAYYSSAERTSTRQEHRKAKEQLAAVRAMSRLRDSGAVIHAADSVTISSTHSTSAAAEVEKKTTATLAPSQTESVKAAGNAEVPAAGGQKDGEGDEASAASPQTSSPPSAAGVDGGALVGKTGSPTSTAAAAKDAASGPRPVQQADGTWEYHYDNGDVTKVRKDGTKVFQTKDLTTTVFVNGDTLFEYPNSTSILDRADGVRITTYADGATKEERLR